MCLTSNVAVSGGKLILTARREQSGWAKFTTGAVNSRDKRFFAATQDKPIRMCIAGSLPGSVATGKGLWPAFWLCVSRAIAAPCVAPPHAWLTPHPRSLFAACPTPLHAGLTTASST